MQLYTVILRSRITAYFNKIQIKTWLDVSQMTLVLLTQAVYLTSLLQFTDMYLTLFDISITLKKQLLSFIGEKKILTMKVMS